VTDFGISCVESSYSTTRGLFDIDVFANRDWVLRDPIKMNCPLLTTGLARVIVVQK
jgi:hypothetical protein